MHPLLTPSYWFSLLPPALSQVFLAALLSFFGTLILASIVIRLIAKRKTGSLAWTKGGPKFASLFGTMGIVGLLMTWTAYEQIRFFGSRFWFLAWDVVFLLWLWHCVKYVMAVVPEQAAARAEQERIRKYLPKKD